MNHQASQLLTDSHCHCSYQYEQRRYRPHTNISTLCLSIATWCDLLHLRQVNSNMRISMHHYTQVISNTTYQLIIKAKYFVHHERGI